MVDMQQQQPQGPNVADLHRQHQASQHQGDSKLPGLPDMFIKVFLNLNTKGAEGGFFDFSQVWNGVKAEAVGILNKIAPGGKLIQILSQMGITFEARSASPFGDSTSGINTNTGAGEAGGGGGGGAAAAMAEGGGMPNMAALTADIGPISNVSHQRMDPSEGIEAPKRADRGDSSSYIGF